jgi:hypothetical protein
MFVSLREKAWNRQEHFVSDVELVRGSPSLLIHTKLTPVSLVVIIRRDIPFCCQLNKKTLRADLATTFGDDAVETRKPFINSEILRLTAIFRAMDAHQLAAHSEQLAVNDDKLKKSAKPLKKKQATEVSEAKVSAVAASLGKPKTPEEDTVARKASLKRCASQSLPPHAFPRALSSFFTDSGAQKRGHRPLSAQARCRVRRQQRMGEKGKRSQGRQGNRGHRGPDPPCQRVRKVPRNWQGVCVLFAC